MTPLESAARAICRADINRPHLQWSEGGIAKVIDALWVLHIPAARAAIEAIREPSDAMMKVQDEVVYLRDMWPRMIDALLKETP